MSCSVGSSSTRGNNRSRSRVLNRPRLTNGPDPRRQDPALLNLIVPRPKAMSLLYFSFM